MGHQAGYCLSPGFTACPIFLDWASRVAADVVEAPLVGAADRGRDDHDRRGRRSRIRHGRPPPQPHPAPARPRSDPGPRLPPGLAEAMPPRRPDGPCSAPAHRGSWTSTPGSQSGDGACRDGRGSSAVRAAPVAARRRGRGGCATAPPIGAPSTRPGRIAVEVGAPDVTESWPCDVTTASRRRAGRVDGADRPAGRHRRRCRGRRGRGRIGRALRRVAGDRRPGREAGRGCRWTPVRRPRWRRRPVPARGLRVPGNGRVPGDSRRTPRGRASTPSRSARAGRHRRHAGRRGAAGRVPAAQPVPGGARQATPTPDRGGEWRGSSPTRTTRAPPRQSPASRPSDPSRRRVTYRSRRATRCSRIGRRFNVTVEQLQCANDIRNPNSVRLGTTLDHPGRVVPLSPADQEAQEDARRLTREPSHCVPIGSPHTSTSASTRSRTAAHSRSGPNRTGSSQGSPVSAAVSAMIRSASASSG